MFGALTEKLRQVCASLSSPKSLTEGNLQAVIQEVRLALLDADVHFSVANAFVQRVKEKAIGQKVIQSVKPKEQFVKILHDELVALLGSEEASLQLGKSPSSIVLCGLQGSGKTTSAAKLARYLSLQKKKVLLVACDRQRPAAVEQLQKLGLDIGVPVFTMSGEMDPVQVAKKGLEQGRKEGVDVLIFDTAGRMHVDAPLLQELLQIVECVDPQEVLFVASAMTGQDAVHTAQAFQEKVPLTGSILTLLDGGSRAGCALSIREMTKKPLKFEGVGEKIEDFQLFHPRSMADRILGMGDVINLVKRAETQFDAQEKKKLEEKVRKAEFTYTDYIEQMGKMKKMGSISGLLQMIPGIGDFQHMAMSEEEIRHVEAMILSMTKEEREEKVELTHHRKKRIALGSGQKVDEVNRMVKGFRRMKEMMKQMPSGMSGLQALKEQFKKGSSSWH